MLWKTGFGLRLGCFGDRGLDFSWGAKSEGAPSALSELTGAMDGKLVEGRGPSAIGEAEGNNDPSGFGGPSALPNSDADAIGNVTN